MLEHLFGSKTRVKLLKILYRSPERLWFVRELARALEVQINAVRRELEALQKIGLVKAMDKPGGGDSSAGASLRKYYGLDLNCILYQELQALLIKEQIMGEKKFVADLQNKAGDIKLLLLSGRFTHDDRSPSDLLIVGNIKERSVENLVNQYEKDFGFPIRYTVMPEGEFHDRRYVMDKFIFSVFEANHVKVINQLDV